MKSIEYSFPPKQIVQDSLLFPKGLLLSIIMYFAFFGPIMYADSELFHNGLLAIPIAFLWFGYSLIYIYKTKKKATATYHWKKVEAHVKNKDIVNYHTLARPYLLPYQLRIEYEYCYQGECVRSNNFAIGFWGDQHCNYFFRTVEEVRDLSRQLIKEDQVSVYVNPENIHESVIMRGISGSTSVLASYLFLLIAFIPIFLVLYIYLSRNFA